MGTLTIRNLDDTVKENLRVRAARHGRSMEEEARIILGQATGGMSGPNLWALSRRLFADQGIDLELPSRANDRPAPTFDDTDIK